MPAEKTTSLLDNSRFYILTSSLLLSVMVIAGLRLLIPSDQLFYIRAQQVFGLLGVLYWYAALVISPLGYVIGKHRTKHLEFARRAIGVSAFYFVLLHGSVALWGQLGGAGQLQYLPPLFKWSIAGGAVAFGILLVMAATSLDKVVAFMTFRRWKWLHRLGYIGGVLAVLHIWTIGTHLAYGSVQAAAFGALIVLSGLELYRVSKLINDKYFRLPTIELAVFYIALWLLAVIGIALVPTMVQNYHSRHDSHSSQGTGHNAQ